MSQLINLKIVDHHWYRKFIEGGQYSVRYVQDGICSSVILDYNTCKNILASWEDPNESEIFVMFGITYIQIVDHTINKIMELVPNRNRDDWELQETEFSPDA